MCPDSWEPKTQIIEDRWLCWIAHHSDWSGIAVFGTEIEALRYAVERQMLVKGFESGEVVR